MIEMFYTDCVMANVWALIIQYSFARCYYLGKLNKRYTRFFCIVSYGENLAD
jgi:hypothetical protein